MAGLFHSIPPHADKHLLKLQYTAASSLAGKIFDSIPRNTARKISLITGMVNKGE